MKTKKITLKAEMRRLHRRAPDGRDWTFIVLDDPTRCGEFKLREIIADYFSEEGPITITVERADEDEED